VQAQEWRWARLALRARGDGFRGAEVDAAVNDGTLIVGWLLRGTLHLVRREDYAWLLALAAPGQEAQSLRRLGQEGVPAGAVDRALDLVESALVEDGPLGRDELAQRVARAGVPVEGQAPHHLLRLATLRGRAVRGPLKRYAAPRDWLGEELPQVDRDRAVGELARRYLAAHAPATPADLAYWAGLPLRDVRALPMDASSREPGPVPARLLPAFDEYMLGWKDRGFAVAAEHARRVHPGGGIIRPVGIVDGQAVATWTPRGAIEPFADADPALFAHELKDVERFG
jgi:hypothetical protein